MYVGSMASSVVPIKLNKPAPWLQTSPRVAGKRLIGVFLSRMGVFPSRNVFRSPPSVFPSLVDLIVLAKRRVLILARSSIESPANFLRSRLFSNLVSVFRKSTAPILLIDGSYT